MNSDIKEGPGIDFPCDIRNGLPLDSDSIDYAVSIHALQELAFPDLLPALAELRRVVRPGGVLRLCLPDMLKGVAAYEREDHSYFVVPDEDALTIGGKLAVQLTWYGYSRSLFTPDFVEELLVKAGFRSVEHAAFGQTSSPYPGIIELDNREAESLFIEGTK
jgi:ubiquinone/menaquinone biosynthesis C-methylase UbiE